MKSVICSIAFFFTCAAFSHGGHLLYDFEQDWQYEEWQTADEQTQHCFPSAKYAVSGQRSIGFISQASPRKPQIQVLVWDNDWEPFEYLSMVITNPTSQRIPLTCGIANENGANTFITLDPMTSKSYVIRIKFPKFARKNNILTITWTALEKMDVEFYIDQIQLYPEGDKPESAEAKKKGDVTMYPVDMIDRQLDALLVTQLQAHCRNIAGYFDSLDLAMPAAKAALMTRADNLSKAIQDTTLPHDQQVQLLRESEQLTMAADRFVQIKNYTAQYKGDLESGFMVGFADSMTKVMPRDVKVDLDFKDEAVLSLAGNEKESIQLAVVPFASNLQDVYVASSDLNDNDGHKIAAENVNCDLVGFVKTPGISDDFPRYIGWYPDPLISDPNKINVQIGDIQTWWIRVRTQENQPAGLYHGTITVSCKNHTPVKLGLNVHVYGFNVPKTAPIPTAITYDAWKHPTVGGPKRWNEKLKYVHADFLADYLMNMDNIYRVKKEPLDWELLKYCDDKGHLSAINLGYFYDGKDDSVAQFKDNYLKAKELGLLDYCYIYGFDEQPRHTYSWIESAAQKFKALYPEVLVLTTAQDHSYGFDGEMETLTGWCPIINRFNPTLAEKARSYGRRVWWYTCNWPKAPYPNVYVDYPAIDLRVLLGLMHAKYQPDGFLYYHTSIWSKKNEQGITTYPWTNWDPWNFVSTNGDGSLFCIDEDGYPVATVRVENYRDGLEDLAYYMILASQVQRYEKAGEAGNSTWLQQAKKALDLPTEYVRSRYDFSHNPEDIRHFRNEIARLIEQSPIKDTNPWEAGMSIWGLEGRPQH